MITFFISGLGAELGQFLLLKLGMYGSSYRRRKKLPISRLLGQKQNKTEWSIARALKWSIFIVHKLALHKNGVEFCHQFNGELKTSLTASYDDVRRHREICYTCIDKHGHEQNGLYSKAYLDKK